MRIGIYILISWLLLAAPVEAQWAERGVAIDVDVERFGGSGSSSVRLEDVPLAVGVSVDLELEEFEVLLPGAVPVVSTPYGDAPLPAPSVRLFRGRVSGEPESRVFLAIGAKGVMGSINAAAGDYEISTDASRPVVPGTVGALVYPFAESSLPRASCGVTETAIERMMEDFDSREIEKMHPPHIFSLPDGDVAYAVMGAYETDLEFLAAFNGDATAALDFVISTIGRVSSVFESEVNCQIVVGHLKIWATPDCPYTEAGDIYRALQQVQDHWSPISIPSRAYMMVLSGKPWQSPIGVVTEVNRLCNTSSAYGYVQADRSNGTRTFMTIAHETGHLFGAHHTHNCVQWNGQLDHCFFPEEGNCFTEIKDTVGTLMSYCSTRIPSFGPVVGNFLKNRTETRFNSGTSCVVASRSLAAVQSSIDFRTADVGTPVDTTLVGFFRNNGASPIVIEGFSLSGSGAGAFLLVEPTAFPFTLYAGESRDLKLRYLAPTAGTAQAILTIGHDAYDPDLRVLLDARAVVQQPILQLELISSSGFLDFGTPALGKNADTTFRFRNNGTAPLSVTKVEIVGRDRLEFSLIDGSAPFELAPGASREGTIRLTGATTGLKQAWLRIESNSMGGAVDSVRLIAVVRRGPVLEIRAEDKLIDFGKVIRGRTSDTTIAPLLVNAGSDTLHLTLGTSGPDAADFTVEQRNVVIAPGSSVPIDLIFNAEASKPDEPRLAWLIIDDETNDRADTVTMIAEVVTPTGATPIPAEQTSLAITPNPTTGNATVMIHPSPAEAGRHYSARITDLAGRELRSISGILNTNPVVIDLKKGDLPPGLYYIIITTTAGTRTTSLTVVP